MTDTRKQHLSEWARQILRELMPQQVAEISLESVSGDASFRRYFRAELGGRTFIAVDAPPTSEDSEAFVRVCNLFRDAGVNAPKVFAVDYERGFMLLDDFGDSLYLPRLLELQAQGESAEAGLLYESAIRALVKIQLGVSDPRLEPYSRAELNREMALFEQWFCGEFLGMALSDGEKELIACSLSFLEEAALRQPQVAVHRDYHSRNLLILDAQSFAAESGPGIIDFQDAVTGAYTYDLVSLLRDCYIRWPQAQLEEWAMLYFEQARSQGVIGEIEPEQFLRDLDLMGLQRHLKVLGIFARLHIRDNKPQYLADIPLVIQYFLEVSQRYPELAQFHDWFNNKVLVIAKPKLSMD